DLALQTLDAGRFATGWAARWRAAASIGHSRAALWTTTPFTGAPHVGSTAAAALRHFGATSTLAVAPAGFARRWPTSRKLPIAVWASHVWSAASWSKAASSTATSPRGRAATLAAIATHFARS